MRAALILLLLPAFSFGQSTAREIIEQAIVAHGGKETLAKSRADKVKLQGTFHVGDTALPFTNEMTVQMPGQYKSIVTIHLPSKAQTMVQLLDGEKATSIINGEAKAVSAEQLSQLKQTLRLEQAMRLVPLLTDPAFTLTLLPEVRYNNQVYVGVAARGNGQRELKLYFDKATGLLVKSEHTLDAPSVPIKQEAYYAAYRDLGGYKRPTKLVVYRGGKKIMEANLIDAQRYERIDPVEFTRP